ncbi:hypothetical protein CLIB1444_07S02762 [[Candida] jaroonii]|uniref:Uncharacterized protein n=1 Tax=[Candida] jaroonii TaxID=467808 RepID=A0ACA9Y9T8_9ASCO|nr:hypothetical protein CLIB1444_07S02762 [[Candida] jaroonii]
MITLTDQTTHKSKSKVIFIVMMFIISLATFLSQTEFTSQAYSLGFKEPIILLLVTHGSWWILWPLQVIVLAVFRVTTKFMNRDKKNEYQLLNSNTELLPPKQINYLKYFKKSIIKQFHNVYHTSIIIYENNVNGDDRTENINELIEKHPHITSNQSIISCADSFLRTPSIKYIVWNCFLMTVLLNVAGFTWYGAMSITYASDVTAIYNCSAFTAYVFAIPLLKEKFSWLKASSVMIAVLGVFVVAYSGSDDANEEYPLRFWGNLAISVGAVIYGLYEVFYKKYLCIPEHLSKLITPRRQLVLANFVMSMLGFFTLLILLVGVLAVEIFGFHSFNLFDYENVKAIWLCIVGSIVSNLMFSASFLSLISLTGPVLSSVSSLLTIFLIGVVEWILFGNVLSSQQIFGDLLVVIGFVLLTVASWKEISEGSDTDDVEIISNYSFALSVNTNQD